MKANNQIKLFALTLMALVISQTGVAGDPFSQGDKQLSAAKKEGIMVARQNPRTGETVYFNLKDVKNADAVALKGLDKNLDAKRADLLDSSLASLDLDRNRAEGKFSGVDSDKSTAAWYGYYYGWYRPVYYTYYRVTWYYSWTVYYGGYSWYIYC